MTEPLNNLHRSAGKGVKIAVVDSGIEADHPWLGGRVTESWTAKQSADGYEVVPSDGTDLIGHGTAIAGNIRRFVPDADIISVQIFGAGLRADSEALLAALRWLVDRNVDVINLSLSTMRIQLALKIGHAIDDLSANHVTCVCARGYHLTGRAYPTDFASTIAVNYRQLHPAHIVFRPRDSVEFDAAGIGLEVAWKSGQDGAPGTRVVQGSSYACPLVTGLAARFIALKNGLAPYEVKSLIKAYAERQAAGWWEPWMDAVALPPGSTHDNLPFPMTKS